MFTGIVEEQAPVDRIQTDSADAKTLVIRSRLVHVDAKPGDSIAVNGCCLTVISADGCRLSFQAGAETLCRTNLGELRPEMMVNLERAIKAGDRLGGHHVTGHVDGVGLLSKRLNHGDWSQFWIRVAEKLTRQMASKGSVAVDGISLTLVDVDREEFSVALIPHTLEVTNLVHRAIGDRLNVETDILAKYVERQLLENPVLGRRSPEHEAS
jgi:riboflavin synthase